MALSSDSSPEVPPFENLGELRREHDGLLEHYSVLVLGDDSTDGEVRATDAMKDEIAAFVARGLATGGVLDAYPERTTAQTLVDYWVTLQIRCGHDTSRRRLTGFDERRLPELDDALCPYVGLEPFHDSKNFFGRDGDIERLAELVAANRLVIVHGSSGSGKSSLVFGGLLPRLRTETARAWSIQSFTPGDDPAARLSVANASRPEASLARHMIVIDQFEELFTLVSEQARDRFDVALTALLAGDPLVHVVVTVREEFYARLSRLSSCATYTDFSMRPLGYADLTAAIERPAARINLTFERGIVETLVTEVLGQPAALPLLQFSLLQLWNARSRNRITREALDRIGGPRDALARAADAFIDRQIAETATEIRRVLVELVRVDDLLESYRQPVKRSVLVAAGNPRTAEVISLLEQADLVRVTEYAAENDPIVEIKHEAIIRNWPRLDAWIVQKRKSRRNQLALLRSAQEWDKADRPTKGLYKGWQLQETAEFEGLSRLEQDFIEASHADADREFKEEKQRADRNERLLRKERRLRYTTAIALIAVVGFAVVAFLLQQNETQRRLKDAEKARQELASAKQELASAKQELASAKQEREKVVKASVESRQKLDEVTTKLESVTTNLDSLTKVKQDVRLFRKAVIASRDSLAGRYMSLYSHGQEEDGKALVWIMQAAGMRSDLTRLVQANNNTFLQYFYVEDQLAAQKIVDLFSTLRVKIELRRLVKDPRYFGPNIQPPVGGLLELYFADGGVPRIGNPSLIPPPAAFDK